MICVELNDLILDCVLAMRSQHEVCECKDDDAQARMEVRHFAKLNQFFCHRVVCRIALGYFIFSDVL